MTAFQVILTMFLVRIPAFREKGTDPRTRSVPLFAYSVQRAAKSGSLMGDPVQEHYGMTAWGNHGMIPPLVILTMFLVRIPAFREKGTDPRTRSVPIFAYSDERVFVF